MNVKNKLNLYSSYYEGVTNKIELTDKTSAKISLHACVAN